MAEMGQRGHLHLEITEGGFSRGSRILTHYPRALDEGIAITSQEADTERSCAVVVPRLCGPEGLGGFVLRDFLLRALPEGWAPGECWRSR